MQYQAELNKLRGLLGSEAFDMFEDAGVIIAGGAITSIFTNQGVNDLDIYFKSEEQFVRVLAAVFNEEDYATYVDMGRFDIIYNGMSQRTLMLKDKHTDKPIQFMTFKWFPDVQDIFDTFDFTVCMGAYDFGSKEFKFHPDFMQHNSQRYLKFNPGTAYPIMSLMRVDKYRKKGYNISKAELLRVLVSCMDLKLESWDDARDHVGGMYGYDLTDVFDDSEEFNLENLSQQLSDLQYRQINSWVPEGENLKFMNLCQKFCQIDTGEDDPVKFDDNRYLYKCVDSLWRSPMHSKKLTYTEGEVFDIAECGPLYFHLNSYTPFHCSDYWVEAEVTGEVRVEGVKKVVYDGEVRVVRTFNYNPYDSEFIRQFKKKYSMQEACHD